MSNEVSAPPCAAPVAPVPPSAPAEPRRLPRWLKRALIAVGLLLVVAGLFIFPRVRGMGVLQRLGSDDAIDPRVAHPYPLPLPPSDRAWTTGRWLAGLSDSAKRREQEGLLFFHGITDKGLDDPAIHRVVQAFRDGGVATLAQGLPSMVFPEAGPPDLRRIVDDLRRMEDPKWCPVDITAGNYGVFAVCTGGAMALRGIARHIAAGGKGPKAVLLHGCPYDMKPLVQAWLAWDPNSSEGSEARRDNMAFARRTVLLAALPRLIEGEDVGVLVRWLRSTWTPESAPTELRSDPGKRFAAFVLGVSDESAEWQRRAFEAAWPNLQPLSLADAKEELVHLEQTPVFLVHGKEDALVPVSEMKRLAEALPHARLLESELFGHTERGSAGWRETWRHVTFLDDFLDALDD